MLVRPRMLRVGGSLLLVPQFTLAADTKKGTRASFASAANPEDGQRLFGHLVQLATDRHPNVETGQFAAHMEITMTNDGPVTFWLRAAPGVCAYGTELAVLRKIAYHSETKAEVRFLVAVPVDKGCTH